MSSTPPQETTDSTNQGPKEEAWADGERRKFQTKSKSEFYDPCQEAAQRSYKCLFRNNGDKNMCGEYFQAYRDCKQAWTEKRKKDRGSWW